MTTGKEHEQDLFWGVQTKGNLMRRIDVTDEFLYDIVIDSFFLAFQEANLGGNKIDVMIIMINGTNNHPLPHFGSWI